MVAVSEAYDEGRSSYEPLTYLMPAAAPRRALIVVTAILSAVAFGLYLSPGECHERTHWSCKTRRTAAGSVHRERTERFRRELEDWLPTEREMDDLIACGAAPYG